MDEYRLMVFPVVLGAGRRLFAEAGHRIPLEVVDLRQTAEVLILTLRSASDGE